MAPSRKNGLSGAQARLLHAFCACNYIHLPLTRQHKTNVPVSRFTPSRHFQLSTFTFQLSVYLIFLTKASLKP